MKTVKYQGFPSQSFSITGSYPPFFAKKLGQWGAFESWELQFHQFPLGTTQLHLGHGNLRIGSRDIYGWRSNGTLKENFIYIYLFCRPPSWGFTVIFPLNQFFGIKVVLNNERFEWKPHQGMEKNKKKIATSGDFTVSWVCYPVSHRKCWLWTGPRM